MSVREVTSECESGAQVQLEAATFPLFLVMALANGPLHCVPEKRYCASLWPRDVLHERETETRQN